MAILADLSTRRIAPTEMAGATRRLRSGLLVHGSSSDENVEATQRLVWASDIGEDGDVRRQGIALANGEHFISDVYERVFTCPGLKDWVVKAFPGLEDADFDAFEWVLWLLVCMVQMFPEYEAIERSGEVDVEEWVDLMSRVAAAYFRRRDS